MQKNVTLTAEQIKIMKEQSFKTRAIAEIKQAVRDVKKGVFLF